MPPPGCVAEDRTLVEDVTVWDVGGRRQVQIEDPDVLALPEYLCARDVSRVRVGQLRYTFICNPRGGILNDPVLLRVGRGMPVGIPHCCCPPSSGWLPDRMSITMAPT